MAARKTRESKPVRFRQTLFWDVDPKTIDPQKHAKYIIERIADFGTAVEIRWALQTYGLQKFRRVVRASRVTLPPTKRLWLDVLGRKTR